MFKIYTVTNQPPFVLSNRPIYPSHCSLASIRLPPLGRYPSGFAGTDFTHSFTTQWPAGLRNRDGARIPARFGIHGLFMVMGGGKKKDKEEEEKKAEGSPLFAPSHIPEPTSWPLDLIWSLFWLLVWKFRVKRFWPCLTRADIRIGNLDKEAMHKKLLHTNAVRGT